jgi:hypothetical protein
LFTIIKKREVNILKKREVNILKKREVSKHVNKVGREQ